MWLYVRCSVHFASGVLPSRNILGTPGSSLENFSLLILWSQIRRNPWFTALNVRLNSLYFPCSAARALGNLPSISLNIFVDKDCVLIKKTACWTFLQLFCLPKYTTASYSKPFFDKCWKKFGMYIFLKSILITWAIVLSSDSLHVFCNHP